MKLKKKPIAIFVDEKLDFETIWELKKRNWSNKRIYKLMQILENESIKKTKKFKRPIGKNNKGAKK